MPTNIHEDSKSNAFCDGKCASNECVCQYFRVEVDEEPKCPHCKTGQTFVVVNPNGKDVFGLSFHDEETAEDTCEIANRAFEECKKVNEDIITLKKIKELVQSKGGRLQDCDFITKLLKLLGMKP